MFLVQIWVAPLRLFFTQDKGMKVPLPCGDLQQHQFLALDAAEAAPAPLHLSTGLSLGLGCFVWCVYTLKLSWMLQLVLIFVCPAKGWPASSSSTINLICTIFNPHIENHSYLLDLEVQCYKHTICGSLFTDLDFTQQTHRVWPMCNRPTVESRWYKPMENWCKTNEWPNSFRALCCQNEHLGSIKCLTAVTI